MKNMVKSLLVKCIKVSELDPKLDSGSCFISIDFVLKYLKGTQGMDKYSNGWIGIYSPA